MPIKCVYVLKSFARDRGNVGHFWSARRRPWNRVQRTSRHRRRRRRMRRTGIDDSNHARIPVAIKSGRLFFPAAQNTRKKLRRLLRRRLSRTVRKALRVEKRDDAYAADLCGTLACPSRRVQNFQLRP